MPNTSAESTIYIEPAPIHCPQCGAEYRNIQHPLKPPEVNMSRECDCKMVVTQHGAATIMVLVQPDPTSRPCRSDRSTPPKCASSLAVALAQSSQFGLIVNPHDCKKVMSTESIFADAEIISHYSRAQAIEDGVLVDLLQGDLAPLVKEAGFKLPIAVTAEVFHECIGLTKAAERAGNDIKGRAWDILWMLKLAIGRAKSTDRINFQVMVVRDRVRPTRTDLVAVCGPGDDMAPVITIMYPHES